MINGLVQSERWTSPLFYVMCGLKVIKLT
jgi:hypothetical protein